uniref:Uncharacterized protein MANES_09G123900 n=1 Tax=Rhizophora mucronata TaxID=61149 RepID=A0A2P2KAB1_RHIMU
MKLAVICHHCLLLEESLHWPMSLLLNRTDQTRKLRRAGGRHHKIKLVLHARYRQLVDRN